MAEMLHRNMNELRSSWTVNLPVSKILEGANAKLTHHKARAVAWHDKRVETKEKLRKSGVTFDNSVMDEEDASYLFSNSGRNPGVSLDATLVKDLNESNSKIQEHKNHITAYSAWVDFLSQIDGDLNFDLTRDDFLFFFSTI